MRKRAWGITVCCLLAAAPAWAGAGRSGAQILLQDFGARPAGMAGAYTALGSDINSLDWNPAGIANLEKIDVTLMHWSGVESMTTEWVAGAVPVPGLGTLAAQFVYAGQPPIDNQVPDQGTVEVRDMVFGVSFATTLAPGLRVGINGKMAVLTLGPSDTSALAIDLGAQYDIDDVTRVGAAVRQLGSDVKFNSDEDPLPTTWVIGVSRVFAGDGPHSFNADVDVDYLAPEQNTTVRVGGEYWFRHLLALRAGYAYSYQKTINTFSAGVGFRFKIAQVEMNLDYALRPQIWENSDFDLQNLISLGARF